jgi:cell division protein FtsL
MKKSVAYTIIVVLVGIIIALSAMLLQSQNNIKTQRTTILKQQEQITQLQAENEKLSAATPENLLRMSGQFAKEKGVDILKKLVLPGN